MWCARIIRIVACTIFAAVVSVGSTLAEGTVEDSLNLIEYGDDGLPIERWRAYGDVNLDGMEDLIISEDVAHARAGALYLRIYLRDSTGELSYYDSMVDDPHNLCIERCGTEVRIWTYEFLKKGCGLLVWWVASDAGLIPGGKLEINPGESGGRVSNAVLRAVYQNSDAEFKLQRSHIVDGKVQWEDETYSVAD